MRQLQLGFPWRNCFFGEFTGCMPHRRCARQPDAFRASCGTPMPLSSHSAIRRQASAFHNDRNMQDRHPGDPGPQTGVRRNPSRCQHCRHLIVQPEPAGPPSAAGRFPGAGKQPPPQTPPVAPRRVRSAQNRWVDSPSFQFVLRFAPPRVSRVSRRSRVSRPPPPRNSPTLKRVSPHPQGHLPTTPFECEAPLILPPIRRRQPVGSHGSGRRVRAIPN